MDWRVQGYECNQYGEDEEDDEDEEEDEFNDDSDDDEEDDDIGEEVTPVFSVL
jgi:hypothetical protein